MTSVTRRTFAAGVAGALTAQTALEARPNILWITCEDIGPDLHVCGQPYSVTPRLDELAARSLIYMNAWSNAPVCAPARTTIISGLYPPATGSEHMRSNANLPAGFKMFPQYLREAGYYCTNNSKEDYNLTKPGQVWDESSNKAHWRNRASGQPFFAVFNNLITHESQIWPRPHKFIHDPAKAPLPAFHPDTPEVRQDWAEYYDNITTMDTQHGKILDDLRADGLADDTVVVFFGDHGSGMPGYKRNARNTGLNVSILIHIPDKFRALAPTEYRKGAKSDRMVGFIDLAPTMLSLASVKPPDSFHGAAFAGKYQAPERPFNYGFRGRMDERYDMVRAVRDKQYVYVRNYMPHKPRGQHVDYMFKTPTTRVWKALYDQGKLNAERSQFWRTKPAEELYELSKDKDEIHNLADSPAHRDVTKRMREVQEAWAKAIRDVGFLPEGEIHSRAKNSTPWEVGHSARYPLERIMAIAGAASSLEPTAISQLLIGLKAEDSTVRYWSALGFVMRGEAAVRSNRRVLLNALDDRSDYVKIAAAEALGRYSDDAGDVSKSLDTLLKLAPSGTNDHYAALMALNALDAMGDKVKPRMDQIKNLPTQDSNVEKTEATHCELVKQWILTKDG